MALIQLRLKDKIFARMLEITLAESRFETEVFDKESATAPEDCDVIITDAESLDKLKDFSNVICIYRDEKPKQAKRAYRRPVNVEEIILEIHKILQESSLGTDECTLSVDVKRKKVSCGSTAAVLSEKEFSLFLLLFENRGRVVTVEEISEKVWKNETAENSNIAAVYINYLRKKLDEKIGKKLLYSVRGKGYTMKI
jgi:hypothetical protein